jgi:hypothetical protein
LYDEACTNVVIAVADPTGDQAVDVHELADALRYRGSGAGKNAIRGDFVGVFRWHPLWRNSRTIELVRVSDVRVTQLREGVRAGGVKD